jgi:predicted glycogen debranching enzyme
MLDFGRDICGQLACAMRREWLVTNGIGGYAAGTIAGLLTRRYHGLLIAALQPPLGRTLLLTKLDETVLYGASHAYPLAVNRWSNQVVEPEGYRHLERFHLEGTTPVWTYACADARLEKRVWMQPGANTTYVRYDLRRATAPLCLSVKALVNYRDHHDVTRAEGWRMHVSPLTHGLYVRAFGGAAPFYLRSDADRVTPQHAWYHDYYYDLEAYRGLDALDDHLYVGLLEKTLEPGDSLTLICSTDADVTLDSAAAYEERQAYERSLLAAAQESRGPLPEPVAQLVLAADQFVVRRPLPENPQGCTVIAGYPWFGDWGRDTMIGLPGLALCTGRPAIAGQILRTFAHFIQRGMLPNRFPDEGEWPEYNTVDATLWYLHAVRATYQATGDDDLVRDLYPVLQEIVTWHQAGTRYGIHVDAEDGLLYAGQAGVQLTWMDAKVEDWVVTPRTGKPVEVNALWYNALRTMAEFAALLGEPRDAYDALADRAAAGFSRFWNAQAGYCYDVLDGPAGDDPSLRPNQLLAVSLPHSPLAAEQQRAVVDACARHLLTSHGLRSLAPDHPDYAGRYGGGVRQRDGAYHQGTVWGWLIGPFVDAHLRVYRDPALARSFLEPLLRHLDEGCVGSVSEIFDGDPPFVSRGCFAQAWSVAELLRAWQATTGDGGPAKGDRVAPDP